MIIKKITVGFVIQKYDTETKKWVGQEFIAGDDCDYEDEDENQVDPYDIWTGPRSYLPFDMSQP